MEAFHFGLQPCMGRNSRYPCPTRGKPYQFTCYLNTQTGEPVDLREGKCNREAHCNYHYTFRQYFVNKSGKSFDSLSYPALAYKVLPVERTADSLPWDVVERSLAHYNRNAFARGLAMLLTEEVTLDLVRRYVIGITHDESSVF